MAPEDSVNSSKVSIFVGFPFSEIRVLPAVSYLSQLSVSFSPSVAFLELQVCLSVETLLYLVQCGGFGLLKLE